ncbi:hypothetical protein, partial [uncultured Abyssibacter sp.]|uniref:hypothetical protein n=1 Tax=uncultured Abyssibacter sp. TaxID=2320202 RepID=UPI0032B2F0A3
MNTHTWGVPHGLGAWIALPIVVLMWAAAFPAPAQSGRDAGPGSADAEGAERTPEVVDVIPLPEQEPESVVRARRRP